MSEWRWCRRNEQWLGGLSRARAATSGLTLWPLSARLACLEEHVSALKCLWALSSVLGSVRHLQEARAQGCSSHATLSRALEALCAHPSTVSEIRDEELSEDLAFFMQECVASSTAENAAAAAAASQGGTR